MAAKWTNDPQYSHAYLVPAFAVVLLWLRRRHLAGGRLCPNWWGILPLLAGVGLRLVGTLVYFDWLEAVSLLPMLAGAALLLGGRPALRWSWLAIAFLVFMIPLPFRVETGLAQPLQGLATRVSTYVLQTLGRPAFAEGNLIVVNDVTVGVVEACSGLGMLLLFFALATAVAILSNRPLLDKALIVASAAPIAVGVNVLRISVTSILYEAVGGRWADLVFHDLAGWLMMPAALGLLGLELKVLSRLLSELPPERPSVLAPFPVARASSRQRVTAG
jgi:exosortase